MITPLAYLAIQLNLPWLQAQWPEYIWLFVKSVQEGNGFHQGTSARTGAADFKV